MGLYRRKEPRSKVRVWWISYYMSGKQYRESSGFTNKRAAEKLLAMRQTQLFEDRWSLPKSQAPKFSEFAKEFLDSIQHDNTRSRYESSIHNLQNIHSTMSVVF